MPSGVYQRTEKHKLINKGRTHTNRKKYFKGRKVTIKTCEYCKKDYEANYKNAKKSKFCSLSCSAKSRPEFVYSNLGKTTSEKQKQSVRSRVGTKHPRWIKNRTAQLDKQRLRGGGEWKDWRKTIFERDDFTCQECRTIGGRLEPHHIVPLRNDMNIKFDINNGITLCRKCHMKTFYKEHLFEEKYKKILTPI